MHLSSLLEITAGAIGDRTAVGSRDSGITYDGLLERSRDVGRELMARHVERLVAVDVNSEAVPVGLFAAAMAGLAYVPVNYRLADAQLAAVLARCAPGLAVVEPSVATRITEPIADLTLISRADFLASVGPDLVLPVDPDINDPAILLFTSGTTGEPKAAILRHRHLTSYVLETVDFLGSDPDDATLVSVPPYHIAGIAAVLTSVWSGRRLVYLPQFSPRLGSTWPRRNRSPTPWWFRPCWVEFSTSWWNEARNSQPCATSPTAVGGCRSPLSSGPSSTCPMWAWSMPMA